MRFTPRNYSVAEEISHSAIHAVGSHFGAAMLALMVVFGAQSGTQVVWKIVSGAVFGATIILLYYGDIVGLKGKWRQIYGWGIIIASDIALAAVTIFEMKRLFISEAEQQPLVNGLMYAMDFGLGVLLVLLAGILVWRLIDLFKSKGRWTEERSQELSQEVIS